MNAKEFIDLFGGLGGGNHVYWCNDIELRVVLYMLLDQGVFVPVSCAFAKLVGLDCVQVQSRGVDQCVQNTLSDHDSLTPCTPNHGHD